MIDPTLASDPTDNEMRTLQKINQLFTFMAINPDPLLASTPQDGGLMSMHKLNQLLYDQVIALSNWQTLTFVNGSSDPDNPVQYRLEPFGIVRMRGTFVANAGNGSSQITNLPAAFNQTLYFSQTGIGTKGSICTWVLQLVNQVLSFTLSSPSSETSGSCGLNGVTYTYQ